MCIANVYFPGWDVINLEINLISLIKPFFSLTGKSRQKFKYLENEKSFSSAKKTNIFHQFFIKGIQLPKIVLDLRVYLQNVINNLFFHHQFYWNEEQNQI